MPAMCHQLGRSAPDERTCHHCAMANPATTAAGSTSTGAAIAMGIWLVTSPPTSSATMAPPTTIHPITPPSQDWASGGGRFGGSLMGGRLTSPVYQVPDFV